MNIFIYALAAAALISIFFIWLGVRFLRTAKNTEAALLGIDEALKKRNMIALDLLRMVETRITPGFFPVDDIRKYGRLTAVSKMPREKASNAELCRNRLADFLKLLKDYPEVTQDPKFIDVCVELRKAEDDIDVSVLKYNNMAFVLKHLVPRPFKTVCSWLFSPPSGQFFSEMASSSSTIPVPRQPSTVWDLADAFISAIGKHTAVKCSCGLEIRVPPYFKGERVSCQLCGASNTVPSPELRAAGAILNAPALNAEKADRGLSRHPKTISGDRGWGRLRCSCGNVAQLSPGFQAPYLKCSSCGKKIAYGAEKTENVELKTAK